MVIHTWTHSPQHSRTVEKDSCSQCQLIWDARLTCVWFGLFTYIPHHTGCVFSNIGFGMQVVFCALFMLHRILRTSNFNLRNNIQSWRKIIRSGCFTMFFYWFTRFLYCDFLFHFSKYLTPYFNVHKICTDKRLQTASTVSVLFWNIYAISFL